MEEELRIKKRLIDLLNEKESIKVFELLNNEFYIEHQRIETKLKENDNNANKLNDNDRVSLKEIDKKEEEIEQLLYILENEKIINVEKFIGSNKIKKSLNFKNFKKGFYIKLILNELFENYNLSLIDHEKISLGVVHEKDLDMFYAQGRLLIRGNIIKGSDYNSDAFTKKGAWRGLIKPEIIINDFKLDIILDTDELEMMSKIEKVMSEGKISSTSISVSGSNINVANGDNNAQTININESELIQELLETTNKIKDEIGEARHKEIVSVLNEIKSSKNKTPLWERFISLTADIGTLSTIILQSVVPVLAMLK